jgi:hypothetical protein
LGGGEDGALLVVAEAGGAEHVGLPVGDGVREVLHDGGVEREVDHRVGLDGPAVRETERVRDRAGADARDVFHGGAERGMVGALGCRHDGTAFNFGGAAQQVLAHAAGRSENRNVHSG